MPNEPTETIDAFLCLDANLPKLERCKKNCTEKYGVLCIHRFDRKVCVEHCNAEKFRGWSDLRILTYFLGRILESIAEGSATLNSVFLIVTRDRNFIDDVQKEWVRTSRHFGTLKFDNNTVSLGDLVIFVECINSVPYVTRRDYLKRAFLQVNEFLNKSA